MSKQYDLCNEAHCGAEPGASTAHSSEGRLEIVPGISGVSNISPVKLRRRLQPLTVDEHVEGILAGDRVVLGKTITLIESRRADHHRTALEVMRRLLPFTGNAVRIGITGVPGAGKSTFIEAIGLMLCEKGHTVAVLAIDPSSSISSGSIMGDKTRMEKLSVMQNAFIRPSPSAGSLGGVARKTREAMLVCEAAGFDVVLIETVGVGQSETMVHSMVDCFLLLMLAGAGDQLQGIKRGIMELADLITITKADGENTQAARVAKAEYETALHLLNYPVPGWKPPVHVCSALEGSGIKDVWESVEAFRRLMDDTGYLQRKRQEQALAWMHDAIRDSLHDHFYSHSQVRALREDLERQVADGSIPPLLAAQKLLEGFFDEDVSPLS